MTRGVQGRKCGAHWMYWCATGAICTSARTNTTPSYHDSITRKHTNTCQHPDVQRRTETMTQAPPKMSFFHKNRECNCKFSRAHIIAKQKKKKKHVEAMCTQVREAPSFPKHLMNVLHCYCIYVLKTIKTCLWSHGVGFVVWFAFQLTLFLA